MDGIPANLNGISWTKKIGHGENNLLNVLIQLKVAESIFADRGLWFSFPIFKIGVMLGRLILEDQYGEEEGLLIWTVSIGI